MAESCRLSPVVFRRNGTKIEEHDSKLFKDIKKAVKDYDTSWKMWAYTKTADFKESYKNLEYDELGEVTFPSLIKALGLEETYNEQKSIEEAVRDYKFNKTFDNPNTAMDKVEEFNSKEKNLVASVERKDNKYTVEVSKRTSENVNKAREQSLNRALSREIVYMLRSMGFDVGFVSDPKFEGIFDPTNAKLHDGLLEVIRISKGEKGEEALPEEFAHLIIEGLQNHPLVQRLFETLDDTQVKEILGQNYDGYYKEYDGDSYKLLKEAAGQLLAQHIKNQGTIREENIQPKRHLLSRIWNWAKGLFRRVSNKDMEAMRLNAYDRISDIYNLVASGEAVPIIDKSLIVKGDTLYQLNSKYDDLDKTAHEAIIIQARVSKLDQNGGDKKKIAKAKETYEKMKKGIDESADPRQSILEFLKDANTRLNELIKKWDNIEKAQKKGNISEISEINKIARVARTITTFSDAYEEIISALTTYGEEGHLTELGLSAEGAQPIVDKATMCMGKLNSLKQSVHAARTNILYNASRTVYKEDKVRGVGSRRDEVLSLETILEHAERDINFVDRWLSAMSDADDALLVIVDNLVKNQQYARDMEMIDLKARIDKIDKKLRDAGYSSSFMYEMKDGEPTFKIISPYDWDAYNEDRKRKQEELEKKGITGKEYFSEMDKWRHTSPKGADGKRHARLIEVYVDPENERKAQAGEKVPEDAITEWVPNPEIYPNKKNTIENLAPAQKEYYYEMLKIKREMMCKIPHRGQGIYRTINISKDLVEGVLDNSVGNPLKATLENFKKNFLRRPDDIGFGVQDTFKEDLSDILDANENSKDAADAIINLLKESVDDDIEVDIEPRTLKKIIDTYNRKEGDKNEIRKALVKELIEQINSENFYLVETDFANHRIQKLPVYYTRKLKNPKMLSTDFTSTLVAYSAMATNYEKMDQVVDILELTREYINDPEGRQVMEQEGGSSVYSKFKVFGDTYRAFVSKASNGANIASRMNDYMSSVVYEERKANEGSFNILGVDLDVAKTLDSIKDYTGLLGLGFNIFSTISNVTVGKLQQWIEAVGGEYFSMGDYLKGVAQYSELIWGCLGEIGNPIKKNKLSLLIQMFDPMGDYFESLRNPSYSKSAAARILGGNSALAYLGMNAGEHMLHCQTMLAILNATKLKDKAGNKVSLYDALEVKEVNGVYKLVLKEGLSYERTLIDNTGSKNPSSKQFNKNYGKPLKTPDGKIITEVIDLDNKENIDNYIMKKKKIIRKVNDSLNGAFSANDKGAAHRIAILRLIMQFRQWMPAHYERRFARGHYDADLEQWREGYYRTFNSFIARVGKDLMHARWEALKSYGNLSEHEQANLRRAMAEISMFLMLWLLCKMGGRVKDRDRSWLDKMALYQINRMKLEVGASMPGPAFLENIFTLLKSPAAAVGTLEKFFKVLNFMNMFDEVQTGRYQGWSEWERDVYQAIPALGQISKALDFDDSMFSMFGHDD